MAGSSTPIYLDNVACSGSEANVFDCVFVMAQGDYHSEDIGVKCFDQKSKALTAAMCLYSYVIANVVKLQIIRLAHWEICDWSMATMKEKEGLKYALMEVGAQYVMMGGAPLMLM